MKNIIISILVGLEIKILDGQHSFFFANPISFSLSSINSLFTLDAVSSKKVII